MSSATIADALREFLTLNELLDNAYWETSTLAHKDFVYDIISILHHELSELNKLSIQDHYYFYEIITEGIRHLKAKLESLSDQSENIVLRTSSRLDLHESITEVVKILDQQNHSSGDFK